MSFNIGEFMFTIMTILRNLVSKLYDVINYQVDITFVAKIMEFFKSDIAIPESISLLSIIGGISAVALVAIIIYNIFKL